MTCQTRPVLFISHDASQTGAPIFLLRFLRWFRQHNCAPFHILIGRPGPLVREFEELGQVEIFEPKSQRIRNRFRWFGAQEDRRAYLFALQRRLRQYNIGIVYSNTIVNGRVLEFLSFLNCPVICHVHELDYAIRTYGDENLECVKRLTASYIAVSHAVKRNLVDKHGISSDQIDVVHGFVPIDRMHIQNAEEKIAAVRRELGTRAGHRLICGCGSIDQRKGVDLFLAVAKRVSQSRQRLTPIHFVWLGGQGAELQRARAETKSLGLGDIVRFVGHRPDVRPYFAAADLLLVTSREDPFPLVILEAALFRKPTICFDQSGGGPEFIRGDAGLVVPAFQVDEMANRTIEIATSTEVRERMGDVAHNRVLRCHDLEKGSLKIVEIIRQRHAAGGYF